MPAFKILDHLDTPLLDIDTARDGGLGRYLPDSVVRLMALRPAAAALRKRLSESPTTPVALELNTDESVGIGGEMDLALDAGARAAVGVHHADALLFPADDLRDAVSVPGGTAYLSVGLSPTVRAALDADRGALAMGFSAGASLEYRFYQPFDLAGADPTLADALADTLRGAVLPATAADLEALPVGAYATVSGEGELQLTGSVELAGVTNPLATPGLPVLGAARVTAGGSVTVGAEWRASGGFEVRVTRVADDRVRLAVYRLAGSEVTVDATAALAVSATVRGSDPIQRLIAAISSDPQADLEQLANAGLNEAQVAALQKAIAGSIDRSLRAAVRTQVASVRQGEALFAYDIQTRALTPEGRSAVDAALRGRLASIDAIADAPGSAIRAVRTGMLSRLDRRVTWRINLFGILNVQSISELLRKGTLSYDPDTGTLNAADEIASQKILVKTRPLEAEGAKVRRLAYESLLVTAAYHASRLTASVSLRGSSSYFEARHRTSSADLRADYNAIIGFGLADAAERERRLGAEHEFGPSTFFVEAAFDGGAADALFIGPDGPVAREHYERIGRDALLRLIPPEDGERAHRRASVADEAAWAALKDAGAAASRAGLEARLGPVRAAHVIADYLTIQWWADAMHAAARALMTMRQFLGGRSAAMLATDPQFAKHRARLEKELASVVRESRAQFGDPWGLLALDLAASRTSRVQASIVSPKLAVAYDERLLPGQLPARRLARVEAPADDLTAARVINRPFTPEERELLRRHAINLRLGAFSTDGEFQTDEADVRRIFAELLPEEIEQQRAAGRRLRLLFYAHGGLIGERRGLEPVLTRLKFWRRNHVYPVSFVWETGLGETVADILRGLVGMREVAARGVGEDLADAFLEVAARPGGRRVWSQMKRSAQVSVLEGGGAAFVAAEVRALWKAHHADVEIHAVGHSAGAIFHAHFLPGLLSQPPAAGVPPVSVRTLHLLAPACTTALFAAKLQDRIGAGRGIGALTMYTMNKSLEQADTAGPYRKSLLYLVSRAFEPEQPAPVLGLEESVREDAALAGFFGLTGRDGQGDLVFATTSPGAPLRARSLSTTHGGFDDDAATMNSVMRRVLDVPDDVAIVDYFQERLAEPPPAGAGAGAGTVAPAPTASAPAPLSPAVSVASSGAEAPLVQPGVRRALCVGIDRYAPPYELAGCVNDATRWAEMLRALEFDVATLHDEAATRQALLDGLRTLVGRAQPGDVIVFQFAGHGTQVDDLDGDEEEDGRDEAFCPVDFADGRLLIDDDVRAVIAGLKPGVNLTCFIDCCHSGTITRAMVPGARPASLPRGSRPRFVRYSREISARHRAFRETRAAQDEGVSIGRALAGQAMKEVCFSACQPFEVAYETDGAGQFTTHAMRVLAPGIDLTHEAFVAQVTTAFGERPAQRPYLDCVGELRRHRLLQPFGVAAPGL